MKVFLNFFFTSAALTTPSTGLRLIIVSVDFDYLPSQVQIILTLVLAFFVCVVIITAWPEVSLCSCYSLRQTLSWKKARKSLHCSLWLPLATQEHQGPTLDVELSRQLGVIVLPVEERTTPCVYRNTEETKLFVFRVIESDLKITSIKSSHVC